MQTFNRVLEEHLSGSSFLVRLQASVLQLYWWWASTLKTFGITHSAELLWVAAPVSMYFKQVFSYIHVSLRTFPKSIIKVFIFLDILLLYLFAYLISVYGSLI